MSSWAVPGARCVCVKEGRLPFSSSLTPSWSPVVGDEYTVVEVNWVNGREGLVLAEQPDRSWAFWIGRFRPFTKSTKTQEEDVAMFWDIMAEEGEKV